MRHVPPLKPSAYKTADLIELLFLIILHIYIAKERERAFHALANLQISIFIFRELIISYSPSAIIYR